MYRYNYAIKFDIFNIIKHPIIEAFHYDYYSVISEILRARYDQLKT